GPVAQSTGTFHIDLGTISEDFYPLMSPNGELDTEDVDVPPNGFDADEDVGLDTVEGVDGEGVPGDDGDDDYNFEYDSDEYSGINGTEWNERLDTEDLNGNGRLDRDNSYWTLTVDLSDTTYLVQDNSELVAGNHWRKYRIPLGDAESVNGMASWLSVKSARIWVEGLPLGPSEVMIGSMDIIGSQWAPVPIVDEDGVAVPEEDLGNMSFRVGTKNTKEDADYDPPFDPGNDEDTNLPKREQSLFLLYENLRDGHTATARKIFYSEEDYTGYQSFDFYLHGDAAVEDGTTFFMRIGRDSLNYYEYSLEVRPGWVQDRSRSDNLLVVPFTSFTDLKLGMCETCNVAWAWGDTNAVRRERFKVVGRPSLSRIRRLGVGVRNDVAGGHDISGEIWLDDIRLSDVRKDIGWAERLTVDAKFADFLDMDFDLRHVDGEFRSLKRERGSGQDNVTYNLTGTMNADRFVSGLGISTPVNVTWKRSVSRPKFSTGSDIVLDDEQSELEKTETLDRSIAVSLSRKRQSPSFWTHLLVDGISLRASLGEHEKASPTKADTSRTIRGRVSYRYSPEKKGLRLFRNTEIFLKPSSIRFNVDAHVIQTRNYDISALGVQTKRSDRHDKKLNANGNIDFQLLD
ncbi:cell surface protein SprA, partial [bacterium]|nr:cell surface protein SprA [bacterium]